LGRNHKEPTFVARGAFHLTSATLACIISSLFDIRLQRRWNNARERCRR